MSDKILNSSFSDSAVHFNRGLADLENFSKGRRTVLFTDAHILSLYKEALEHLDIILLPRGESVKSLENISSYAEQLLDKGLDRDSFLVAFGGGAITDFTGFLASTYKRGVSFGLIPTTVLAQVDAAIGGKTGVNLGDYKNMIGTFSSPECILIDSSYTQSLEHSTYIDGFAEIIKHALVYDAELFSFLEANDEALMKREKSPLEECIKRAASVKLDVVKNDQYESGIRKILNFGHTVGHAIEKTYGYSHGSAVSIGMVQGLRLSQHRNMISEADMLRAIQLIDSFGLPTELTHPIDDFFPLIFMDKKKSAENIDYIYLSAIGKAEIIPLSFPELKSDLKSING